MLRIRAIWAGILVVCGFVTALFGISLASGTPVAHILTPQITPGTFGTLANACIPDSEDDDEVFFLSCGGIF